jgi:hypothetical protein
MKEVWAVILSLFMSVCNQTNNPAPKPVPHIPDDTASCAPGCQHLMTLPGQDGKAGCLEARPLELPDGGTESCESYCVNRQNSGRYLHPSCWVTITKCADIEPVCRMK